MGDLSSVFSSDSDDGIIVGNQLGMTSKVGTFLKLTPQNLTLESLISSYKSLSI